MRDFDPWLGVGAPSERSGHEVHEHCEDARNDARGQKIHLD